MNDRLKTLTFKNYRKTCLCKWVNEAGCVKNFKCSDIVEKRHTKIRPFALHPPPPLSNWGRETKKTTEFDIFCKVTHQFIINLKTFD